jgi:hypothetical protein
MSLNFPDNAAPGHRFPPYIFDGQKWKLDKVPASVTTPLMNATPGSPGDEDPYARGDHVHPTDTSRAPVNSPNFTGGVTTDTLTVTISATHAGGLRVENGRLISRGNGQPSVAAYSAARGSARGFFLDGNNYLAFGNTDGAGNPTTNIARLDNSGNFWLNGTAVVSRDPSGPMEVATKQYVDARAASGGGSTAYVPVSGGQMTGVLYPASSYGGIGINGWGTSLEVRSINGQDACMTFHIPGVFATNFGLGGDNNLYMGGWSHAPNYYRLWSARDFTAIPIINCRLAYAGDYQHGPTSAMTEPYGGAVMTGCQGVTYGPNWLKRYRYLQFLMTSWWTVGYA